MKKTLKIILSGKKTELLNWVKLKRLQFCFPTLAIINPISLLYDDINSISLDESVAIGAFSEIVVLSNSIYSNIQGELRIGSRVVIGSHTSIRAAGGRISIGDNTLIAQRVSLIASNHLILLGEKPYRDLGWDESKTGVCINPNVWIGAGATILPGCSIGQNSVVGAGSVVTKSIPENEIWAGVPAKKIRSIPSQDKVIFTKNENFTPEHL